MTVPVTKPVDQLILLGTLQQGDVVVGERTTGTTVRLTVPSLSGGGGGAVDSVNGQTGVVVLTADSISDSGTTNQFTTSSAISRLANTSGTNTGDQTNISGNAATATLATNVTTNANLTGPITSSGNATSVASQTGTGSTFVMNTSPTLITPVLGTPTSGTLTNCTGSTVPGGGTGIASATAYGVICGGTTTTGALQPLVSLGAAGARLTSAGASALPSMKGGLAALSASCNTAQSISASTQTIVALAAANVDTGSYFNTTTFKYTPLIAGTYFFFGNVVYNSNASVTSDLYECLILKNNVFIASDFLYAQGTSEFLSLSTGIMVNMNGSTDYVQLATYQGTAGAQTLAGTTIPSFLCGVLMEAT